MILELLFTSLAAFLTLILAALPPVPPTPEQVGDIGNFIVDFCTGAFGFVIHIYGPFLTGAIVSMLIALFVFEQSYYTIKWILRFLKIAF